MQNSADFENRDRDVDLFMLAIAAGLFAFSLALAAWYSTWLQSLLIGGGTLAMLALVYQLAPGTVLSRCAFAAGFMVFTALHVQQSDGMVEMHFGVFVLLAILLYYRDWLPIVVAAAVIAVHHVLFFYWQTQGMGVSVLADAHEHWWVIGLHAAYVVVEAAVLCLMANRSRTEANEALEIMRVTRAISSDNTIDLTHRVQGGSLVGNSFNAVLGDLEQLVRQAHVSAENINGSGDELAGLMASLNDVAARQKRETEMVAAAIEQMSVAVREVASNAEEASSSAGRADQSAHAGNAASTTMAQEIDNLAAQIGNAAGTVAELNDNSARIGSVLDVIRGIAEQTNLLALNAAIEAARAGELGRGFAVVADEVRTLASRTQQSTAEIQGMIQSLQAGSRAAVDAMDSSQRSVEVCVAETHRNRELLQDVSAAVNDISRMNQMIAAATHEQSSVSSEVARNVASIHGLSEMVTAQATQVAGAGTALRQQSQHLEQVVSRFRVSS
ncbi:MAG: methyl-accepting chemotaxis protein [Verrucomicrobiaceae bacterium]|nr:methyl-accepting chemotaxis protein [Verrucomicrobiaceae bacterium]